MVLLTSSLVALACKFVPDLIGMALDDKEAKAIARRVTEVADMALEGAEPDEILEKAEEVLSSDPALVLGLQRVISKDLGLDVKHARTAMAGKPVSPLTYVVLIVSYLCIAGALGALVWAVKGGLAGGNLATVSAALGGLVTYSYQTIQP